LSDNIALTSNEYVFPYGTTKSSKGTEFFSPCQLSPGRRLLLLNRPLDAW
jgi:hypothetical protein